MSGNELLAVLLCVGAFALILVVRYLINVGVDKASDKIHRISKKKTAASLPQGRFRLADRYDGTLNAAIAKNKAERSKSPQMRAPMIRTGKNESHDEAALSMEEWELEEETPPVPAPQPRPRPAPKPQLSDSEWELEEETPPAPAPQPQPRPAPKPQLSDSEWALEEETPPAPAPQPQPRPVPRPEPVPSPSPARRTVEAKSAAKPRASAPVPESTLPTFDIPDTIPPFQEDRCCICNGELGGKFAVLFKAESGAEARIDRDCVTKFNKIVKGTDPYEIVDAGQYLLSRYDAVDPKVAPYLKKYAKVAYDRLKQWKATNK